jgi:hypothetical protein
MSNTTSTIDLEFPITIAGAKVAVLSMRRASVGDVLVANRVKDDIEREIILFSNLCQVSPDDIRNLDLKDYTKLQEVFRGFTS